MNGIQQLRGEASSLSKPDASKEDLQAALAKIKLALSAIDSAESQNLASDAHRFRGRRFDYMFDAAMLELRLGNKEAFLNFLETSQTWVLLPSLKNYLATPAFAAIQDEPRFKTYLKLLELPAKMGRASVLATPYKEEISTAEKNRLPFHVLVRGQAQLCEFPQCPRSGLG